MFTLYEAKISSLFAGDGVETLVCKNGIILAHVRGWSNKAVFDQFKGNLKGKRENQRGTGWRKLTGEKARAAQTWAAELVDYQKLGMV